MDLSMGIADMAMSMKAAQMAQNYSIAVEAKVLDAMEEMGEGLLELMTAVPKGEYVDVYA